MGGRRHLPKRMVPSVLVPGPGLWTWCPSLSGSGNDGVSRPRIMALTHQLSQRARHPHAHVCSHRALRLSCKAGSSLFQPTGEPITLGVSGRSRI